MNRTAAFIFCLCITLIGCEEKKPPAPSVPPAEPARPAKEPDIRTVAKLLDKQDPPAAATPGTPTGHPPINAIPQTPRQNATTLKWPSPGSWKETPATSQMRKAQFVLPKAAGDPEDGQLIVFYFGPDQGGKVEANVDRWKGMFSTADGKPVADDAVKRQTLQVSGMNVTRVDVTGRYTDQMGRPSQPGPTSQDFRLLAAIVETSDGPWFFKAVGPSATMASHQTAFDEFIRGIHR